MAGIAIACPSNINFIMGWKCGKIQPIMYKWGGLGWKSGILEPVL
jgi:hypothetical protein